MIAVVDAAVISPDTLDNTFAKQFGIEFVVVPVPVALIDSLRTTQAIQQR